MSNLKDIRLKIKSVQNTEKTTKAMKLVSNAKLRKAKKAALESREYAKKIDELLSEISNKIKSDFEGEIKSKFFDNTKDVKVVDIIFITSDKGLCGGFNAHIIKSVKKLRDEYLAKNIEVRLIAIGKKGIEYFNFQGVDLLKSYNNLSSEPNYMKSSEVISLAIDDFLAGVTDKVILVHNGFKSMISQEIEVLNLAPIPPLNIDTNKVEPLMEFEPKKNSDKILEELLLKYSEYSMYYALIDSLAAEHTARMNAMDNATTNAQNQVRNLRLKYNKSRQASITTELTEIINGVEAMK